MAKKGRRSIEIALGSIPILLALVVWLSPLSFVPVPWPDDSAFYFVAKELFAWPPRWVMLPQAPFEPTYRIFNFNTMPLYPFLLGLGRLIGIDGSFAIKFWPLGFWALSGSALSVMLYRFGLPALLAAIFAIAWGSDPAMRWASVLVRPESLIGFCGVILVTRLSVGKWLDSPSAPRGSLRSLWDPISFLLAVAAYAHFNAIHLVAPVALGLVYRPRRLWDVGWRTALYLSPWALIVLFKYELFIHQMSTQWMRLAIGNGWLDSISSAIDSLFLGLGSPEAWPEFIRYASMGLWGLIVIGLIAGLLLPCIDLSRALISGGGNPLETLPSADRPNLMPAAGWIASSIWLWHTKPEVWFIYYIHCAIWTFAGIAALTLWKAYQTAEKRDRARRPFYVLVGWASACVAITSIFLAVNTTQARSLGRSTSWNWSTYHDFVECIDRQLTRLEKDLDYPKPFRVWDPTFPDITIELSKRHRDWDLTRTNDFQERWPLAVQHGKDVEAVVVTEMLNWTERDIDAPWSHHPDVHSVWMEWKDYFLNRLWTDTTWKPNRYLCQKGRWQAFIFLKETPRQPSAPTA